MEALLSTSASRLGGFWAMAGRPGAALTALAGMDCCRTRSTLLPELDSASGDDVRGYTEDGAQQVFGAIGVERLWRHEALKEDRSQQRKRG